MYDKLLQIGRTALISAAIVGVLGIFGPVALAQTITVDISDDVIDINPDTATLADLPGPDGKISFSEAMIASNNTPGRQTIGFAIPTSEWNYLDWYYPGRAVVHSIGGFNWQVFDEVTIDGRTQTAFTGDTNPNGQEVVLHGSAIYLNPDNCSVFGLDNSTVSVIGSNGLVENNSGLGIELFGGSGSLVRNNTGGGYVQIDRSSNNVVVGNTLQRVRILGWIDGGQPAMNNRIGGPSPADRNYITGLGTRNSQGIPNGFAIQLFNSIGAIIENNQIGTTPDGLAQGHPYTTMGVYFDSENHDTLIRGNRIAGILALAVPPHGQSYFTGTAIQIYGSGSGVTIVGNRIGLNANDEPVLGSVTGISTVHFFYPDGISNVVIGGSVAGDGNEIAGHLGSGVSIANTYSGVRIAGNSIHDNGGLGIDLVTDGFQYGVTPNDSLDADTGGNKLQNFPVLSSANSAGESTAIRGSLNSAASQSFTLEFFASPACDPAGHGEGKAFLGSTDVHTNAAGNAAFNVLLPAFVAPGSFVTATAADVDGNTSEFSACIAATTTRQTGDLNCDGVVSVGDIGAFVLALTDPSGYGAQFPNCNILNGDISADGSVSVADIGGFVTLLNGS